MKMNVFYVLEVLLSGGKCLLDVVVERCSLGLFSVRVTLSSFRSRLEMSSVNLFRDVTVSSVSSSELIKEELGRSARNCVTLLSSSSFTGLRSPGVALGAIEILSYLVMY